MRSMFRVAGMGLALMLSHGVAQAAENIECMDSGYDADEQAVYDEAIAQYTPDSSEDGANSGKLMTAISSSAGRCADLYGWSPDAIEQAVFYRMGYILEQGLLGKSPLTEPQMKRLKAAISGVDKARLQAVLGPILQGAYEGKDTPEPSEEDSKFVGMLILRSGIPTTEVNTKFIGSLLGALAVRDMAKERFAKF